MWWRNNVRPMAIIRNEWEGICCRKGKGWSEDMGVNWNWKEIIWIQFVVEYKCFVELGMYSYCFSFSLIISHFLLIILSIVHKTSINHAAHQSPSISFNYHIQSTLCEKNMKEKRKSGLRSPISTHLVPKCWIIMQPSLGELVSPT